MREILLSSAEAFVQNVSDGLVRIGVTRDELVMMDHLCYRVTTVVKYNKILENLGTGLVLLGEAPVNGRNIATLEVDPPVVSAGWLVPFLELPEPKPGNKYAEGLEHAEVVIVGSLSDFQESHADLSFDYSGMDKPYNPKLGYKDKWLSVKFHELSLGDVVRIDHEQGRGSWRARLAR